MVKLQQHVMVTVMEVDVPRKRISLSMKTGDKQKSAVRKPNASPLHRGAQIKHTEPEPVNAFQAKLEELKKKFS